MEILIKKIYPIYEYYKNIKDTTLIYTFGKFSSDFNFDDTIINKNNYDIIKKKLDSCKTWDDVSYETSDKNIKSKYNYKNFIVSFVNLPFDVKLSINSFVEMEDLKNGIIEQNLIKYTKKNHTFILTETKDLFEKYTYKVQIEVLLNNDKKLNSNYMVESSFLKVLDINKMIEENNYNTIIIDKIIE